MRGVFHIEKNEENEVVKGYRIQSWQVSFINAKYELESTHERILISLSDQCRR